MTDKRGSTLHETPHIDVDGVVHYFNTSVSDLLQAFDPFVPYSVAWNMYGGNDACCLPLKHHEWSTRVWDAVVRALHVYQVDRIRARDIARAR